MLSPLSRRTFLSLSAATLMPARAQSTSKVEIDYYFPPPPSRGGWRTLVPPNLQPNASQLSDIREHAKLDWPALKQAWDYCLSFGGENHLLVIRNGWIAAEWFNYEGRRSIASCTKSLTGVAMARLFDLSAQGRLRKSITPDSLAHEYLPPNWAEDDPKRKQIRIRHLLTMCSGLDPYDGPYRDLDAYYQTVLFRRVEAPPGKVWCYSSTSVDLLSFILENASGRTLGQFFNDEIAGPIGIDPLEWPAFNGRSGGSGGPGGGPHYLARELARVGYLTLRGGQWDSGLGAASILSQQRVNSFTHWAPFLDGAHFREKNFWVVQPGSQNYYGHLWWTNRTQRSLGPNVPADAYYMSGYSMRTCVVIPSLDLVIVRLGSNREINKHIEFYGELVGRIVAAATP